ncbi:hypothetical protein ZIOFF_015316 [Zingiber officinale]|uniref:Remorin C-terminal domain-containing protein n=1 Tax=Zingiber officinale TaxID=94328 RepID=A0A8J5LQ62_ZINOF|nr:hypothetical protein ZIOFF_015316 [Zingiber officinale]
MELKEPSFLQATGRHSLDSDSTFYSNGNPFADTLPDPLCKINLKETSEFVKALPVPSRFSVDSRSVLLKSTSQRSKEGLNLMGQRGVESPSTPYRAAISFSPGHPYRKNVPSKWDDAEKWLISSSCHESPAHLTKLRQSGVFPQKGGSFEEKKAPSSTVPSFDEPFMRVDPNLSSNKASTDVLLKDKFTDNVEQQPHSYFRYSEPSKEGFFFGSSYFVCKNDDTTAELMEPQRRDAGTEMTPLGSSMPTRCHTPIKSSSPARHNTPADRSGPLVPCSTSIAISELKDCHFAKLELGAQYHSVVSNWSSREEEEKEVSKSLRHLEITDGSKNIGAARAYAWEEDERKKSCIRYQREEARIQAWLNLQNAKAEAQSRKLEAMEIVKIQKMRSSLEEKLMKRMAIVHRKAEECRAAAQQQHLQQLRASEQTQKMKSQRNSHLSIDKKCGCFPCKGQV